MHLDIACVEKRLVGKADGNSVRFSHDGQQ